MRISIIALLIATFFTQLYCQDNACGFLIPGGSKSWNVQRPEFILDDWRMFTIGVEFHNDHYLMYGDTIIDDVYGQKLYYEKREVNSVDTLLIGVYLCNSDTVTYKRIYNSEVLQAVQPYSPFMGDKVLEMYANVNDTILSGYNDLALNHIVVDAVDTVVYLDNLPRRRLLIRDVIIYGDTSFSELPTPIYLVEGIGNLRSGLHLQFRRLINDWNYRSLICYHENNELVYLNEEFDEFGCDYISRPENDSTYVALLPEDVNKRWNLMRFYIESDTTSRILYNYQDTLIGGNIYSKFNLADEAYDGTTNWFEEGNYVGAFREVGRRLFFKHPDHDNQPPDMPLVDFGAGIEDTIYRYIDEANIFWYGIVTQMIDQTYDDGITRTRFRSRVQSLDLNDPNAVPELAYTEHLVEGVLTVNPINNPGRSIFTELFNLTGRFHTQCFFKDDFQVFHSQEPFVDNLPCFYNATTTSTQEITKTTHPPATAYPNPTTGRVDLRLAPNADRQIVSIELVTTATGHKMSLELSASGRGHSSVDLSAYPAGHYALLLRYQDGNLERIGVVKE